MKIVMRSKLQQQIPEKALLAKVCRVLSHAAKTEGVPQFYTVTVGFTDDEGIRRFNRRFRGLDQSTDVLSFPLTAGRAEWEAEVFPALPGMERPSLGDILISVEHCAAQAEEYGHGEERELCFLALHGFLHLLGYDHIAEEDRVVMEAAAEKYLTALGIIR